LIRLLRGFRLRLLGFGLGLLLRRWLRLGLRLNLRLWLRGLRLKLWRNLAFLSCGARRARAFGSSAAGINNVILPR
jgi:hypothetical protein